MNKSDAYARALELGLKRIHRNTIGEYYPGATYGEFVDALHLEEVRKSSRSELEPEPSIVEDSEEED